jgi:hypothetical protein
MMIRFDSSEAWSEATQAVSANRDVLLALAGVFLVLPSLAFAILVPQLAPPEGVAPRQMLDILGSYYREHLPGLIAVGLLSLTGTLAMIALFTDRSRPTVGEAIRQGAVATVTVIAAQILLGMAATLVLIVGATLAATLGLTALNLLLALVALGTLIWIAVRISLLSPAVVIDGLRNPVAALQRSWTLTQGNAGRLLAFYILLGVAFVVAMVLIQIAVGLVTKLVVAGQVAQIVDALVSTVLQAVMSVYFAAVIAAAHSQLSGTAPASEASLFD